MNNRQAYEYLRQISATTSSIERKVVCKVDSNIHYGNFFDEDKGILVPVYISKDDVFYVVNFHTTNVVIRKSHLHQSITITMTMFKKYFLG